MPWQEVNTVDLRIEFVLLASAGTTTMSELCDRFSISRKTGYKWLKRYQQEGVAGLEDQPKTPHHQPTRTPDAMESLVLRCRDRYPDWGGRKLRRVLKNEGYKSLPAASTITEILKRHDRLNPESSSPAKLIRFEHPYPNDLWQMDFKGHFSVARGRCHPLTILDDCSRYSLCLQACANEQTHTVKNALIYTFTRYGLPRRMSMDNGSPWGGGGTSRFSQLTVWLIEQGITVGHSRPYHPQTQGKDERFHRTLQCEVLGRREFASLRHCQSCFDQWRRQYNQIRPHEALELDTPASRYEASPRSYQPSLPPYEYGVADQIRKVAKDQTISFHGYRIPIGQAFVGKEVAIRTTQVDGQYTVYFCHQQVGRFDLRELTKYTK